MIMPETILGKIRSSFQVFSLARRNKMIDRPVPAFEPIIIQEYDDRALLDRKIDDLLLRVKQTREQIEVHVKLVPRIFFNGGAK